MRRPWWVIFVALTSSCFSADEGEALKRDVARLKEQLAKKSTEAEGARQKLQKVMEQATGLLTRNSADVGAQVERIQTQYAKLVGSVDELRQSITELNQKLDQLQAKVEVAAETSQGNTSNTAQPQPQTKDELFNEAKSKLAAGDHVAARRLLRQFTGRFAADPLAPQAQRMLGDSYYQQQKFAPAIIEYRKVLEQYKGSQAVATSLYKIGMAFYQLKFCKDARSFLDQFIRRFRRHRDASNARKLIKLIKRYRRNPQFCRG